jgi:putative nucleotidyltransferase with HDIG domain
MNRWAGKAIYRISQGLRVLFAFALPLDSSEAERLLTPPLLALFRRMRRADQRHSLSVMRTLVEQGHTDPDLLAAALLHDVGKVRHPITLFGRTLAVLARAFAPKRHAQWGQGELSGWRRPFVVAHQHSVWSAEMLAEAGAPPMVVALARRHQTPLDGSPQSEEDRLLMLLQEVDDAS